MKELIKSVNYFSLSQLIIPAQWCLFLGLGCAMLCVPLMNKLYWSAAILYLLSGNARKTWPFLIQNKIILTSLVFITLVIWGISYTQGSGHFAVRNANKYLKIIYPLFFIPLFAEKNSRNMGMVAFIFTVMISEVYTYIHFFDFANFGYGPGKHWLFVQDIDAGFIVSFAAFLLAHYCVDNKKLRWLALGCLLICSFDLLFLNQERTGYLIFLALTGIFLCQRLGWRGLVSALIAIPLLFGTLYLSSDKFNKRINQVVHNVSDYRAGKEDTSIGLRLAFARYSLQKIKQHWLMGVGTGSFEELYRTSGGPMLENHTWPAHPHNEYISITFQLGVYGLWTCLWWFYACAKTSFQLTKPDKWLLQGLIASFFLLGFCNASLLVNPAGGVYMTFLSLFLASQYDKIFKGNGSCK